MFSLLRIPVVVKQPPGRAELVLKRDQALLIQVRPPKIDLLGTRCLGFLDKSPEQKRHGTEVVMAFVGAAVLIDDRTPVAESQHRGDRCTAFRGHADLSLLAHAFDDILEPRSRLRE